MLNATPLLLQVTYAAVGSFEIGQIEPDPSAPSGLIKPIGYPAICSSYKRLNIDGTESPIYTAIYGEGGLVHEKIQGYYTKYCTNHALVFRSRVPLIESLNQTWVLLVNIVASPNLNSVVVIRRSVIPVISKTIGLSVQPYLSSPNADTL